MCANVFLAFQNKEHETGSLIRFLGSGPEEEEGAWQSLRIDDGKDERCRQAPFSADVVQDRGGKRETARHSGAEAGDDGDDDGCHAPEDTGEKGQRAEVRGFESAYCNQHEHASVRRGGKGLAVLDDKYDGGLGESGCGSRHYSNALTDSAQTVDRMSSLTSSPGVPSIKERPCTADGGSCCFTSNARSGGTRGSCLAPGLQRPQGRCEPLTPRSRKQVLSPFWIPPVQEPPSYVSGPSKVAEERSRAAITCTQRATGSDGDFRRGESLGAESGDNEPLKAVVGGGGSGGAGFTGVEKHGTSSELSAMLDKAPDERLRQNMQRAQEIRDRYLR